MRATPTSEALCYGRGVRQRQLETVSWRMTPVHLSGVTPEATGMSGHGTARDTLRSAAGPRAHDGAGRAALPHPPLVREPSR